MSHTVEILSVGTELLLGNIVNLDAQILSQGLSALGLNVYWHTVVGDNPQRAREAVAAAKGRADIIITTGGLGPTCDDLTKNVLAEAFGKKLVFHEPSAQRIRNYFARTGRPMTENNLQQAMLPEGCTVLVNDWGTAPGCAFQAEGCHVIMLPGPPSECRPMFQHRVVPYLQALSEGVIASHTLKLFGIGESQMEAQLRDEMNAMSNPTLAPYAKEGECELRVTAKAPTMEQAQALLLPKVEELKARFGTRVYGVDVSSLEEVVEDLLREKGLTLGCAESITGGLMAKRLTDIPGSSQVFRGGGTGGAPAPAGPVRRSLPGGGPGYGRWSPEAAGLRHRPVRHRRGRPWKGRMGPRGRHRFRGHLHRRGRPCPRPEPGQPPSPCPSAYSDRPPRLRSGPALSQRPALRGLIPPPDQTPRPGRERLPGRGLLFRWIFRRTTGAGAPSAP